jgi:hypothetical protein
MSTTSDPFGRLQSRAAMTSPKSEAHDVLDGRLCMDYAFIFQQREARITFHMHHRIGKYAEYGRLLTSTTRRTQS